jgi:hypothetical protein
MRQGWRGTKSSPAVCEITGLKNAVIDFDASIVTDVYPSHEPHYANDCQPRIVEE